VRALTVLTLLLLLLLLCGQAAGGTRQGPPTCPERAPTWATDEPSNGYPTWSPNGEELAFASNRSGRSQIYVLRVADCIARQVTSHPDGGWQPDWSPDGRRIAFVGDVSSSIWIVGADGRGLRRLTRSPRPDYEPAWSPDGRMIAFRRGFLRRAVHVVAPNGRGLRRLRAGANPAWSPTGRRIAFIGPDDGTWVMRSDGSRPRRVKRGAANGDSDVDWAPDGRRLVIAGSTSTQGLTLFVKDLRTGRVRHLRESGNAWAPEWSPNGRWIAFTRVTSDTSEDVFVVRPDGHELRRLTFAPGMTT
jgi:TolB protein